MTSLALSDALLASTVSLPQNPSIVYSRFAQRHSASTKPAPEHLELVRHHLLTLNSSSTLSDSLLASVQTAPQQLSIYVFAISSCDHPTTSANKLSDLHFDYMTASEHGSFTPRDLYACSFPCSLLDVPCPDCKLLSSHAFIPRKRLRAVYSHFLEAVRIRLLDDIVKASYRRERTLSLRKRVQRLKGGFLFGQLSRQTYEWEHYLSLKPLVLCHLQVLLAGPLEQSPHLLIHPTMMATPYLPLTQTLPSPPGTPIVLLPHGVPAYYRTTYGGPTEALVKRFRETLQGLGASHLENDSTFIIAQISVENKQGANKGVLVVYPTALCLSFVPSMSNLRQPLEHFLDLPTPLQPSPQVQIPANNKWAPSSLIHIWPMSGVGVHPFVSLTNISTVEYLQAFRSLTLSKHKNIPRVAEEVSSYVESVARERERERERLKREREGASSSPRLARTSVPTPIASATPSISAIDTPDQHPLPSAVAGTPILPPVPVPPNSFYPSPPHVTSNGLAISDVPTSPTADKSPSPARIFHDIPSTENIQTILSPEASQISKSSSASFDPFGNLDSAWPQMPQTYIDMDLEFDMNMSYGMSENGNDRETYMDIHRSMDFEDIFTDDDFSFFDQPSRNIDQSATPIHPSQSRTDQTGSYVHELGPFTSLREGVFTGPGHGVTAPTWPTNQHAGGLLPAFADIETRVPDLSPPSGQTPETDSGPATPDVQLDSGMTPAENSNPSVLKSPFDPIPFSSYHRMADGKYLYGKFALSSPKRDEHFPRVQFGRSKSLGDIGGWGLRYNAITDPRVGVVQKLIGVKRKPESEHAVREARFMPSWTQEDEWTMEEKVDDCVLSDEDSDGDVDDSDSNNGVSRPITPPPSYLPPGPSLLYAQFEHGSLLVIGTPLRSSDPAVLNTPIPISVPTPVSPAAVLGAATEKSKSLEAIASAVAAEVVGNTLWAEAWKSATLLPRPWADVWPADIKYASTLLNSTSSSASALDLASLFSSPSLPNVTTQVLKPLEPPMIAIGKSNAVIYVLPTALRFWEKLGLGPRGGKKNLTVFVLYDKDGDGNQRRLQIDSWLENMATVYATRYYGNMKFGQDPSCEKDGHLPVIYDKSLRKTIASFISNLSPIEHHYAFFLVIPISIMTLASPFLRQSIAILKKALKERADIHAIYQLVPEPHVFGPLQTPSIRELSIKSLCSSVYDRTPSPVSRSASSDLLENGNTQSYIEEPAFTLARPLPCKVSFVREAHPSLDVVDRFTLMHVGYQSSICGKWLVAACIDQRGEAHDIGTWLTHTSVEGQEIELSEETYAVMKVWDFVLSFAKKANVEWRIVITKYGIMGEAELNAWISCLNEMSSRPTPSLHVYILCAEAEAPWTTTDFQHNIAKSQTSTTRMTSAKHAVFNDVSSQTYMLRTHIRLPLSFTPRATFYQSFIPEPPSDGLSMGTELAFASSDGSSEDTQIPHPVTMLPRSSMTLIHVPLSATSTSISMLHIHLLYTTSPRHTLASLTGDLSTHEEITYNFYELSCLAKLRWKLRTNPVLPFHLGAVEIMRTALERDEDRLESVVDV
ncbi:hypothetical protein APHAL10511_005571 [Amanita phalloides]|nr:hypothetical protein APHAL10511_005571 [Amanita phalloides]